MRKNATAAACAPMPVKRKAIAMVNGKGEADPRRLLRRPSATVCPPARPARFRSSSAKRRRTTRRLWRRNKRAKQAAQARAAVRKPRTGDPARGSPAGRRMPRQPCAGDPPRSRAGGSGAGGFRTLQWPVQIKLVPVRAPYFDGADLLIAADCTAYAYGDFHREFIRGRITLIGCPKLDEGDYTEKLTEIIRQNDIRQRDRCPDAGAVLRRSGARRGQCAQGERQVHPVAGPRRLDRRPDVG